MANHELSYRLSSPITNNWEQEVINIPNSNSSRREFLENNPIGPSLAYNRLNEAVWEKLFNISTSKHTTITPAAYRERGILGPISGFYSCQETSNAGYQHLHAEIYAPLTWTVLKNVIHNPDINHRMGVYIDSIVWSEMRYDELAGWRLKDIPLEDPLSIQEALATPMHDRDFYFI